jgi:hypothetical protein
MRVAPTMTAETRRRTHRHPWLVCNMRFQTDTMPPSSISASRATECSCCYATQRNWVEWVKVSSPRGLLMLTHLSP